MAFLKKADEILAAVLKVMLVFMCCAIAIILLIRVIIRFTPLLVAMSWTDEVVEFLMAWMVFTGATLIMRDSDHFKVDILQTKFAGKKWMDVLNIAISVLGVIFIASLLYYSGLLVIKAVQFTSILKVPTKFLYLSIPTNCAFMLIYLVRDVVCGVQRLMPKAEKAQ